MKNGVTLYKLMTLYEFSVLDMNNQMEMVNQKGIYLDNHITQNEKFNLYAIDMFFVEVEYNKRFNKITNIKSFKTGYLLDRYSNFKKMIFEKKTKTFYYSWIYNYKSINLIEYDQLPVI
jgi:hypothetical protein